MEQRSSQREMQWRSLTMHEQNKIRHQRASDRKKRMHEKKIPQKSNLLLGLHWSNKPIAWHYDFVTDQQGKTVHDNGLLDENYRQLWQRPYIRPQKDQRIPLRFIPIHEETLKALRKREKGLKNLLQEVMQSVIDGNGEVKRVKEKAIRHYKKKKEEATRKLEIATPNFLMRVDVIKWALVVLCERNLARCVGVVKVSFGRALVNTM